MLMEMVDECEEIGLYPQGLGRDTEALTGMKLAERVVRAERANAVWEEVVAELRKTISTLREHLMLAKGAENE